MHSEQKAHRGINAYYRRTVAAIILSVLIYASQRVPLFRSLTAASILFNRVHYRAYTHKKQDITTASPPPPHKKELAAHHPLINSQNPKKAVRNSAAAGYSPENNDYPFEEREREM